MRVGSATTLLGALALALIPAPALASGSLKLIPELEKLGINFVVLLLLIYPVNRLLLQPLVDVLKEREARTTGARERADDLATEAQTARASLEEQLRRARADAQQRRAAILAEADAEERRVTGSAREHAVQQIERVRDEIGDELRAASDALRSDAQVLAREAATRILGRAL